MQGGNKIVTESNIQKINENSEKSIFDTMSIPTQKALDKTEPLFSDNLDHEVIGKKLNTFEQQWTNLRNEFGQKLIDKKALTDSDIAKFKKTIEFLVEVNGGLKELSLPTIQQVSLSLLTNYNATLKQPGQKKKIENAYLAIEDAFKGVAYRRIQVSNFVNDHITKQQDSLNKTIERNGIEQNRQPISTVEPSDTKSSKNYQASEGITAKSLLNFAEKSLEIPILGLPLACAFFVASKICDAINFIGSKINSPEKLGPTAKGYEASYLLAPSLAFGSRMMNSTPDKSPKAYETCGNAL